MSTVLPGKAGNFKKIAVEKGKGDLKRTEGAADPPERKRAALRPGSSEKIGPGPSERQREFSGRESSAAQKGENESLSSMRLTWKKSGASLSEERRDGRWSGLLREFQEQSLTGRVCCGRIGVRRMGES